MTRIREVLTYIADRGGSIADEDLPSRYTWIAELASFMGLIRVERVDIVADGEMSLTGWGWKLVGGERRP